jgi:predicted NBD/HSP70 family sugar kinase
LAIEEQPGAQRVRGGTEWLLWERLRTAGPASRAHLARETGLSKPTVSTVLALLERSGLAREAGRLTPERGRTAVLYEPDPTAGYVLGIDIGRARLRTAVADLSGTLLARVDVRNTDPSAERVAEAVVVAAEQAVREAGLSLADVVHTAVGTPGVFDPATGRVRLAVNLPGWGRPGLFEAIRQRLGGPGLSVHNDANLAALGEAALGAGQGSRLFVYLLVGTGLGLGIVADGELFTGAHGAAGEIGFLPLSLNAAATDPEAARRGALESVVSADAVVRAAREHGMTGKALTAKRVFEAARSGDPAAVAAVRQEGRRLALVVGALSAVLDPDLVVLGGGLGHSADLLLATLRDTLPAISPLRPELTASALGEDAVLLGAITTALRTARPLVFDRRLRRGGE